MYSSLYVLFFIVLIGVPEFASAQNDNDAWKKTWTSPGGKIVWSDKLLEGASANCISERDQWGEPVNNNGSTICKLDENYRLLNFEENGVNIHKSGVLINKSDATERCKKIGGILPTRHDFESLSEEDVLRLPNIKRGAYYWTSTSFPNGDTWSAAYIFGYYDDPYHPISFAYASPSIFVSIRCIKRL